MWVYFEISYAAGTVISFAVQDAIQLQLAHCDNGNSSFQWLQKKTKTKQNQTHTTLHSLKPPGVVSPVLALT